ncbi:MAG: serine protease [Pedobacter sp.]|nr:MAG: serine protease [Pedobacter sp.]
MPIKFSTFDDGFNNHLVELKRILPPSGKSEEDVQARIVHMATSGAGISKFDIERLFGSSDLLRFNYLQRGIIAGKPVARIRVNAPFGAGGSWGTGFLITPRLLITNNHVIKSPDEAMLATIEFDYQTDLDDRLQPGKSFRLRPDLAFMTDDESALDYTIVAIEEVSIDHSARSADYGFIRLIKDTHKVDTLEYVSIIQHPNGEEKCIAIRENKVIKIGDELGGTKDNFIWYVCDTALGSSGAPVFNDQWQLVALHHRSVANTKEENGNLKIQLKDGTWIEEVDARANEERIEFIANEGENANERTRNQA